MLSCDYDPNSITGENQKIKMGLFIYFYQESTGYLEIAIL